MNFRSLNKEFEAIDATLMLIFPTQKK